MAMFRRTRKEETVRRCATCGGEIPGRGVQRDGKWFCNPWHAERYKPPPPWWKRLFQDRNPGGGAGCCRG